MERKDFVFTEPSADKLHPQDSQHIRLTYIIHFYFDQANPDVLLGLLRKYANYAPDVLDRLHFVIVDDCSPLRFEIPDLDLNMTWLRITDDILWNQPGARNLGAVYAKSDKILLCDLDYEFPEHTLRHMIARRNPGKNFYQFRHHDGKKHGRSGHGNNFLVSRARFLRLYGYDEEYAGAYGEEDYRLVNFFKYHGTWKKYLPRKYYFAYNERINRDKSWHTLVRDGAHNARLDCRKHSELLVWGAEAGHSRMFLNFKWEVVKRNFRDPRGPARPQRRNWKKMWWFRTLFRSYD